MRRKLLIGAISLLSVVLILIIAAFVYVRSGRLDLFLQGEVVEGLREVGIEAKIGETRLDIRGSRVTLKDIELTAAGSEKPFGSVERMEVQFSVIDYLRQKVNITQVHVTHPQVWVAFDEQGRFNLEALHAPARTDTESAINFLTANVEVERGEVNYTDLARKIEAHVPDFYLHFEPNATESIIDTINHKLQVTIKQGTAVYEGQKIQQIGTELEAIVKQLSSVGEPFNLAADVPEFGFNSDLGQVTAKGKVESTDPLKYAFDINSDLALGEIARVFMQDTAVSGKAEFAGNINGTGANYLIDGTLRSDEVTGDGFRATNVRLDTKVAGEGSDYRATGTVESGAVAADGLRVSGIRMTTDVKGKGDEYKASADLTTGAVSGQGISISSIRLNNATISGQSTDFDVTGGLALSSLKSGQVTVSNLRGRLDADPQRLSLSQFTAGTLGGSVTGSASVAYGGGASRVDVQFRSIDLNQAAALASAKDVTVRGTANGAAQLSFPGLNYKAATGRINATFDASISPPQSDVETQSATGQINLLATGRGFNIQNAFVRSANSEVSVKGTVGWNGAGSLAVDFKSTDMAEVQRVIDAFGFIPENIKEQYKVALAGEGQFTGRVEGRLAAPAVTGHLRLEQIQAQGETVGTFEGDIAYSPSLVRVDQGSLVRADGSRADFSISAPLVGENNIAVKANVQNFDLPALVKAAVPEFQDFVGRGVVNGTVDLRGLPGPRTIEGTANLSLSAGEFNVGPSDNEEGESKRISVPEFNGNITLANSIVSVENLRLQVGDSNVVGKGSFNLDTYEYTVNAEGKNVDLAQVADAAGAGVKVTGRADVAVNGQGKFGRDEDWSDVNLNATIQGQNVALNGREVGDAKLVAFTQNGVMRIEATGNVLDQQRTLAATIDFRDRKNWPVSANVEFVDADIGKYLGLVAPELSGISGKATGTVVLSGPLLDTDQIRAVATLTKLELGGAVAEGRQYTITNQGDIVLTASPREITLNRVVFTGEGTSLALEGSLSREGGARSNLRVDGEINLRFVSAFTQAVFATGVAQVQASIVGSLDSPQLLGSVTLKDIGARVVDFPLSVARGNGLIRFTADQALIERFTASTPGGGNIRVEGGAALVGLVPDRWRFEVEADQVGVEYPRDTQTVIDANLALQGNRRVQVLSGDVFVRRAAYTRDITIEELITTGGPFGPEFLETGPGGGGGGPGGIPTTLDLHITADNTLSIRNNLADAVASAFINLRGPIDDPIPSGRVILSRGTLEFRNGRYELTRGVITLPARRGADPVLDIESEADISGYRVSISFSGELSKLQTTLRSDPELPETDIISLVLTGSPAGDRSTAAAVTQTGLGLAQSILSASLLEGVEKGTQRLFGLSRFSIDPLLVGRGGDPTARITIGQRIAKDLTVTYSQNLTSGPSGIDRIVLVEYRISNRFSVVGYRNERGELGFDMRFRKRF